MHTKGPWKTFRHYVPGGVSYRILRDCHGANDPTIATVSFEANARLIAEAPTMYDQLATARAIMQRFVNKVDDIDKDEMIDVENICVEMKAWLDDQT